MITITKSKPIIKGNYKQPKQNRFIQSGTKDFESKIITSLRNGNTEYVARFEQARNIQGLATEKEQVIIMQVDGMYELKLKKRGSK